jgi:hypothetical protein
MRFIGINGACELNDLEDYEVGACERRCGMAAFCVVVAKDV